VLSYGDGAVYPLLLKNMHTFHLRKYNGIYSYETDNNNVVTSKSNSFLQLKPLPPSTIQQESSVSTLPFADNATCTDNDRKV